MLPLVLSYLKLRTHIKYIDIYIYMLVKGCRFSFPVQPEILAHSRLLR